MPRDANSRAHLIIQMATGEAPIEPPAEKNPAAVALGRLGGLKGGKARARKLSKRRLSELGRKAARKRWSH